MRDAGYDVAGFYGIGPRFGDLGDVVDLLDAAGRRGIRILVALAVNHTCTEHPWFQEARRDRTSPVRDLFVWRDEPPGSVLEVFVGRDHDFAIGSVMAASSSCSARSSRGRPRRWARRSATGLRQVDTQG